MKKHHWPAIAALVVVALFGSFLVRFNNTGNAVLTPSFGCYDTDGRNYYVRGSVTTSFVTTDKCADRETLVEFFCDNGIKKDVTWCPAGCLEGTCRAPLTPSGLSVSSAPAGKVISWKAVPSSGYYLYKDEQLLVSVSDTTYFDVDSETHSYSVSAYVDTILGPVESARTVAVAK